MTTTRGIRSVRRAAAKRTILSALDENNPSNDSGIPSTSTSTSKLATVNTNQNVVHLLDNNSTINNNDNNNNNNTIPHKPFRIPKDVDCTNSESIHILLQDIEKEVKQRQESVAIKCCEAIKKQHEAYFLQGMKIEKSVKKMTIGEFNEKYMKKSRGSNNGNGNGNGNGSDSDSDNCNEEGKDIIALMKSLMSESTGTGNNNNNNNNNCASGLGKKRFRNDFPNLGKMDLETPARPLRSGHNMRTPATILRTAKRGEMLMSVNGSPVEPVEDGSLIATVSKKRRANGNGIPGSAAFDINVGGKVISLSDPSAMSHLSNEMKNTVSAQLNVLQDQISRLMTQIDN